MSATASRVLLLGVDVGNGTVTGVTTGTSIPVNRRHYGLIAFYLRSIGTTSGGTITIEEADWGPGEHVYSGTWSSIVAVDASSFTGGAQRAYHVEFTAASHLRVRVSSDITGGGSVHVAMVTCPQ